ncbi:MULTISPECIES: lasso peptide biosynthesis PqqD family chaperone [Streptomyces]|uniref:Lasso peptide biosynthesis PqqD family chaperone n=1 Tax=Streptomyces huasconensis TaxID=1854574 RepID=A0ABV3LYP3_9ACTN|nr:MULTISPECIES: lasso peptide biosynthesis PqqD family chaperone [Streptomyces]UFQ19458.1 lasso peptide biosynthesis PqqD family chaperone [Streptomyces huasconensis]WCL89077.1 lasso peptide biosynthesis PqqD family chaperone [Streptomyces sp. JCM 35825]
MTLRFGTDVSTAETQYGTVLLDQRTGDYWELNPTGALVVRTLMDDGDEAAAVTALVAQFAIDRDRAERDVTALVSDLRNAGLLS